MHESLIFFDGWTDWMAWGFWVTYYITFYFSNRKMTRDSLRKGRVGMVRGESPWLLAIALLASHLVAFVLAWFGVLMFPAAAIPVLFWVGLVIMVLGMLLRLHCYRQLGAFFTPQVRVFEDHRVIQTGAYRVVRHPGYLATLSMMTGLGLAVGGIAGLLVLLATGIAVFAWRIRFEERAMLGILGQEYGNYARGKKRLIPFIY